MRMNHDDIENTDELKHSFQPNIIDPSSSVGDDDDTIIHSLNDNPECAFSNHPIENEVTKRDAQRVWHMKLCVIFILILSAVCIAAAVYVYVTSDEIQAFRDHYYNDADKVYDAIGSSFERTLSTLNAVSILLVTYSQNIYHKTGTNGTSGTTTATKSTSTWPFVTLPNFAGQVSKLLPITNGLYIAVLPIVTPSQKKSWEEYAYEHDGWVNESLALQEVWGGYHGNVSYDWSRSESIYDNFDVVYPNVR